MKDPPRSRPDQQDPGDDGRSISAAGKGAAREEEQKDAFSLMQQAHVSYPSDPYILSYYGWLQAVVDKRYRSGVETCATAVALLRKHAVKGREVQFGSVYANLVRAYLAAGKKKNAHEALLQGLKYEAGNKELLGQDGPWARESMRLFRFWTGQPRQQISRDHSDKVT